MKKQPVIIVGMHRSGTSMLTRFISDLGVFMGKDVSENDESVFFQSLNKWLLYQAGASWDKPQTVDLLDQRFMEMSSEVIKRRAASVWNFKYMGFINFIKYRKIQNINRSWGWKDPRNTLLLPIYKEIFPNAKIVHIYRNPIDVALSLQTREFQNKTKKLLTIKERLKISLLYYERILNHSFVVENTTRGYKLWEYYTKKALEADNLFEETIHVKYEDFLSNPKKILYDISQFLEIEPNEKLMDSVVKKVNPNRAFAFKKDRESMSFYEGVKEEPLMTMLGYNDVTNE